MSIREKHFNSQIEPYMYERISKTDSKLKMIYDRYHKGKSIIMDDLKYVCLKDPDGCNNLVKSIVESKSDSMESESNKIKNMNNEINIDNLSNEKNGYMDSLARADDSIELLNNAGDMMASIKTIINNMNENEKKDMLKNLFTESDIKKINQDLKYWDETYTDRLVMYTYTDDKEFNMLV